MSFAPQTLNPGCGTGTPSEKRPGPEFVQGSGGVTKP